MAEEAKGLPKLSGIDLKEIFKLFSVKLSLCFSNKIEEILEYIDLVSKIFKKETFIKTKKLERRCGKLSYHDIKNEK